MLLYFTYNDQPSGVYWSQVTDVVAHLNTLGGPRVRLFALVSGRDFLLTRRAIKQRLPNAIVWPMVPRMKNWKRNLGLLAAIVRLHRPTGIICRGVMTTWMALRLRERGRVTRVCFDARGAYAAEWEEYRIIDDDALIGRFRELERESVNSSDLRLAVSNALVAHWRERYGYARNEHVVIPCTLGADMLTEGDPDVPPRADASVRLVYSGSTAGWQSFGMLENMLAGILETQPEVNVLFLSKADPNILRLADRFPGRVEVKWLPPAGVAGALRACDHGILVREDTITNRVSSPTKFAEYLAAGLRVVISDHLGDFSTMVKERSLGTVVDPGASLPEFTRTSAEERSRLRCIARDHFTKRAFEPSYRLLLERLG